MRRTTRPSREVAWLLRGRARAETEGRPWCVYLGWTREAYRLPRIRLRSAYDRAPNGSELVAFCSSTGRIFLRGEWSARSEWLDVVEPKGVTGHAPTPSVAHGA